MEEPARDEEKAAVLFEALLDLRGPAARLVELVEGGDDGEEAEEADEP
ncbi:MAG TPA: hypothetical protein VNJ46_06530 [Gaiellaceae bacterium]|nr:hypothetical protein [Gaiellaceae bacterium]